jgi:spore maturation protein CgeB
MKILWLYKYDSAYNFDKWLHMEFVRTLSKCPGVEVIAYGYNLEKGYPDLCPFPFNPSMSMEDLKKSFDYDVVILNTKSRAFLTYHPTHNFNYKCWLPGDFRTIQVPKICIEEDYHYEKNDFWYYDMGFNLLIQRHYSQSLRSGKVKNIWLPFSVDINVFHPIEGEPRLNKICYVGSLTSEAYPDRLKAIHTLSSKGYIDVHKAHNEAYLLILRRYVGYLSSSSLYNITAAKNFEIMASGGVLITNRFSGIDQLFPDGTCIKFLNDHSDLIPQVEKVLRDQEFANDIVKKGLECIKQLHTHEIRIGQLLEILNNEFSLRREDVKNRV